MPGRTRVERGLAALSPLVLLLASVASCSTTDDPVEPPRPWLSGSQTWQFQLSGELDPAIDAEVFVLDGFDTTAQDAQSLRARGRRLICHVGAGAYESDRPDAGRFPADAIGSATGRPDERWLDIRQWQILEPILADRFRLCRGKGFDAVAPDGVQGYTAETGFPLTFDDQLAFNRRLAVLARSLGLSPGLRNDVEQAMALQPDFDFAINEECVRLRRCDRLVPFVDAGKPVFHVEYEATTGDFCVTALGYGFSSMRKDRALGVWRAPCLR